MQPKSFLLVHIALLPVYITILLYLNLLPTTSIFTLTSLLRLARSTLHSGKTPSIIKPISTEMPNAAMSPFKFVPRPSEERGHADHGWLKTFHTFSFASYQDQKHELYGPLRVINEDRVAPRTGFGTHSHSEFEIFSYVMSGQLEHKDSMGNTEILSRGDLQLTSAGTGIAHSEKTYGSKPVHFLQIWSLPQTSRLEPKYFTRHFTDEEKTDKWVRVVAPVGAKGVEDKREAKGPAPVQSALTLYAALLGEGTSLSRPLEGKKAYVHVIQKSGYNEGKATGTTIRVGSGQEGEGVELREGDGVYVQVLRSGIALEVGNIGDRVAEVLVFDLE